MPFLTQVDAKNLPLKQWDLREFKTLAVGRGDQADARVDDDEMSRKHFQIAEDAGGYVIRDLDSKNGTRVNGKAVAHQPLERGDKIRAGGTRFVFEESLGSAIIDLEKKGRHLKTFIRDLPKPHKR